MNNELKEMLQAVLKEALKPIDERLDRIENEQQVTNQRLDSVDSEVKKIKTEQRSIKSEMHNRFDAVDLSLQVIQTGQQGEREEMTQRFKEVKHSLSHLESDITLTFQKTAKNELELNRIKNQ